MSKKRLNYLKHFLFLLIAAYCVAKGVIGGDFKIYLKAAELLKVGKSCYNVWIHLEGDKYSGYSYSPIFATILIPFTVFPLIVVQIAWSFLQVFFLYRIYKIISDFLPLNLLSKKQLNIWILLSTLVSLRFILHNIEMLQMTILLLYLSLESIHQLKRKHYLVSGSLIAFGIVAKIIPIVMIPYFIYRKYFKSLVLMMVSLLVLFCIPIIFYGWDFYKILLSQWWGIINFNNTEFVLEQNKLGEGVQSLSGFLGGYFTDLNTLNVGYNRTITKLSPETFNYVLNITRLFFICLTLYFVKFPPFTKPKTKVHQFWELSYIFTIIPLIFPHQQNYAFFFMAPASTYIMFYLIYNYKKNLISALKYRIILGLAILFFMLTTLTTDGLVGVSMGNVFQYFKTITLGVFVLIIMLMLTNPSKMKLNN